MRLSKMAGKAAGLPNGVEGGLDFFKKAEILLRNTLIHSQVYSKEKELVMGAECRDRR